MSETVLTPPRRRNTADYEATAAELLDKMNRLDERLHLHQAEGERLKTETQVIKARTTETLSRLQEHLNRLSIAA